MDFMEHQGLSRNSVILILLILSVSCTSAKKERLVNLDTENIRHINGKCSVNDTLFSGTLYRLYPESADTVLTQQYINGKRHGMWRKYYKDGRIKEQRFFKNGKKEGKLMVWWPNGRAKLIYNFRNDVYEGTNRAWNRDGLLIKEMNYEDGHEKGEQKVWYDNGKIKSNYIIKEGRRYGLLGTKNCISVTDSLY